MKTCIGVTRLGDGVRALLLHLGSLALRGWLEYKVDLPCLVANGYRSQEKNEKQCHHWLYAHVSLRGRHSKTSDCVFLTTTCLTRQRLNNETSQDVHLRLPQVLVDLYQIPPHTSTSFFHGGKPVSFVNKLLTSPLQPAREAEKSS
jgi:hypothetical protein